VWCWFIVSINWLSASQQLYRFGQLTAATLLIIGTQSARRQLYQSLFI